MKWTGEQRLAMRVCFPALSEEELVFIEKASAFADGRPANLSDQEWGDKVIQFLQTEGASLNAWKALGEALGAVKRLPKDVWRERHPFGACLAAVLKALQ